MFNFKMSSKSALMVAFGLFASTSAFAYGGFAAIVYDSETGAWGSYHGAYSQQEAVNQALGNCSKCGNAVHQNVAYNGWVALARGNDMHWGTAGVHTDQGGAEQSAFDNCGGAANGCQIIRSTSSYVNYPDQDGTRP